MKSASAREVEGTSEALKPAGSAAAAPALWRDHARALMEAVAALQSSPARAALTGALEALSQGAWASAEIQAQNATPCAPGSALPLRIAAMAREGAGDAAGAIDAYQAALALEPNSVALLIDLARLAQSMNLGAASAEFLGRALAAEPQNPGLAAQLGSALLEVRRFTEAVEVLSRALRANPEDAALWNVLGAALVKYGDTERGLAFLEEALSLAPGWSEALYNRAIAKLDLGDLAGSTADCDRLIADADADAHAQARFVRAQARLAAGDLEAGWRDYEARLSPSLPTAPIFHLDAERWTPATQVRGRSLLILGEQGLGDEIMFSSMIPDLLDAVGPEGRLVLAVSPRLTKIFGRSFPGAHVVDLRPRMERGRLVTPCPPGGESCDLWAPMGSFAARYRQSLDQFTPARAALAPAPEARALWADRLSGLGGGLKVGICWKSLKTYGHRAKHYPPLDAWSGLLQNPAVRFVNLQYGDCRAELEAFQASGAGVYEPADLDRMNDLDGALALSAALDLVIGVANASTALAAAAGAPTWFIFPPAPWPALGSGRHPWYPQTRGFYAERYGAWGPVFDALAARLSETAMDAPRP